MIGSAWRTIGEYGRHAALLLAVVFMSLALSGETRANESHQHDHHAHGHHAHHAEATDMVAGQDDHDAQTKEHAHAHDGECHCLSASCAPLLMPAMPGQIAALVVAGGHDLPSAISADAQAVSGPPARPPRA